MKNYVISRNIISKDMISDYQNYFLTGWRRLLISSCSAAGFALAALAFMSKDYIQMVLMLAVAIFGLAEILYIQHLKKKELIQSFGDNDEVIFSLSFAYDGFTVINITNKQSVKVLYSELVKIDNVKHGYVIVTKGKGFFIINKESLKNGIEELNEYLKKQGVKLSRWPK